MMTGGPIIYYYNELILINDGMEKENVPRFAHNIWFEDFPKKKFPRINFIASLKNKKTKIRLGLYKYLLLICNAKYLK